MVSSRTTKEEASAKVFVTSVRMNLGLQYFYNVVRPTKGTVSDLRFLVEFSF